jgi:hypothetical protein
MMRKEKYTKPVIETEDIEIGVYGEYFPGNQG